MSGHRYHHLQAVHASVVPIKTYQVPAMALSLGMHMKRYLPVNPQAMLSKSTALLSTRDTTVQFRPAAISTHANPYSVHHSIARLEWQLLYLMKILSIMSLHCIP